MRAWVRDYLVPRREALIRARCALPSKEEGLLSTVLRMRQIFTEICEIVNYSVTLRILLHPLRHYYWVELTVVSWILYCKWYPAKRSGKGSGCARLVSVMAATSSFSVVTLVASLLIS